VACFALGVTACLGAAAQNASGTNSVEASGPKKWQPYIELEAKPGTQRSLGTIDLFMPLAQDDGSLLFWLFRGVATDDPGEEGNFGLAYRHIVNQGGAVPFILGGYGFYDVQSSATNHVFDQFTFGAELLTTNFELRANGYWNSAQRTVLFDGVASQVFGPVQLDGVNVVQTLDERSATVTEFALPGYDIEAGLRLPIGWADGLWVYGAYYDLSRDGVEVRGPRGRVELPFDAFLGYDNVDLTLGAEVAHDDVRDTQGYGYARLRIRFGGDDYVPYQQLSAIDRRMTARIRRDDDIVTGETAVESNTIGEVDVTDAPTGESLQVFHVANSAQGSGDCTTPGNACTVATAQGNANYGAGDTLVPVDVAGTIVSNAPLNAARQQIVGGGNTGTAEILLSNAARSTLALSGLGGRATLQGQVTLVEDATVKGFDINNPGGNGVLANSFLGNATAQLSDLGITGGTGVEFTAGSSGRAVFASDVAINNTTGTAFSVLGGTADIAYAGTITQTNAASAIDIANMTGGGATFSGAVVASTSTADAVTLASNTGAEFQFSGGLDIDTTSGDGFAATGGGTVAASGTANTIATTTGMALNLDSVTVATDGVTFRSVSASNPATSGLRVNNTGGTGAVRVTGDGVNASSGGTIENAGGAAVQLTDTQNISLAFMRLDTPSTFGIQAQNVSQFDFSSNTIVDAGSTSILVQNGSGTGVIANNTISSVLSAFDRAVRVSLNADADLTIDNNTINSALTIVNHGIDVAVTAGDATVRITDNALTSTLNGFGDAIHYVGSSTGEMTTVITGNTIINLAGAFEDGIDVAYSAGTATTTISGNTIGNADLVNAFGDAIKVALNTTGATSTTISDNTVGQLTNGMFDDGIEVSANQGADHTVTITDNIVGQIGGTFDDGVELSATGGVATFISATIRDNILLASAGGASWGLEANATGASSLCSDVTGNLTDTALTFISAAGSTIDVVDLPTLSLLNLGATVNQLGLGTIQGVANCP
jgi:inverse autotransporter-like protein with beta domain/parallel beta helix pectate lyase-like protein